MRTTIRMNAELARRAKEYAAKHDRTFTDVVEEAVSDLLASRSKATRSKLPKLPVVGNPRKRITHEEYRAAIEQMYEEDAERIYRGNK